MSQRKAKRAHFEDMSPVLALIIQSLIQHLHHFDKVAPVNMCQLPILALSSAQLNSTQLKLSGVVRKEGEYNSLVICQLSNLIHLSP